MAERQRPSAKEPFAPWKEWLFGSGTFFMTMCLSITNTFFYFFLTNVVMMSPTLMGYITTISQIIVFLFAPLKGVLIGNTEWKGGKYGTWVRWVYPISILFYSMTFFNLQASPIVQFCYYCCFFVLGTCISEFSEGSLLTALSKIITDPRQIVRASSKRSVVATAGQVLYSLITVKLCTLLGKGVASNGYLYCYILYGLAAILGYQLSAWMIKPYDYYKVDDIKQTKKTVKPKRLPLKVLINAYLHNIAAVLILVCDILKAMASLLYAGGISYYLTYYAENYDALTIFLFIANVSMLFGSYLAIPFCNKFGKKITEITAYGGFGVALILGRFIGIGEVWGITLCVGLGRFFSGFNASLLGSIYADVGDYYENKTGYNLTSFYISVGGTAFTIARIFVGTTVAATLAKVGYSATALITMEMKTAMLNLVTIIPGIPLACASLLFLLYPLTEKKMQQVRNELSGKKIKPNNA